MNPLRAASKPSSGHEIDRDDAWSTDEHEALIRFLVAWPDWKRYFSVNEIARYIHDDLEGSPTSIRSGREVEAHLHELSVHRSMLPWTRVEVDTLDSICKLHPLLSDREVAMSFRQATGAQTRTEVTPEHGRSMMQCVEEVKRNRASLLEQYAELCDQQAKCENSLVETLQPGLCEFCKKLDFGRGHEPLSEMGEESGRTHRKDEFHSSIADLDECAQHCWCCGFISQCVRDKLQLLKDPAPEMENWKLQIIDTGHRPSLNYQYKWGMKKQDVMLSFHTVHGGCTMRRLNSKDCFKSPLTSSLVADWGITQDRSSPSTIKRLTNASSKSANVAPQIKAWMRTCQKYHRACRTPSPCTMPDRVLDLGCETAPNIRLISSSQLNHPYAALSYCWGTSKQYLLTSETTGQLAAGVEYKDLAKTTKDAIDISRAIGLQYLWVDALCIYQDDRADWERQSARMDSIYANALLTLVASNASSTAEGFLRDRSPSEAYCGYTTFRSQKKAVYLCQPSVGFEVATFYERSDMVAHEPLSDRGWAQQERLLSGRKVLFGARQMFWQCRESTLTENGLMPDDDSLGLTATVDAKQPHAAWIAAVENFSKSKLTRMSDRLPALSGLASNYAGTTGDRYLAGHWYNDIAKDSLLWRAQARHSRQGASAYRAPSWSWASIDGPVLYPEQERAQHLGTYFSTLGVKKYPLAAVHDHEITVKGANSFGEVIDGWLDLHASVIPLRNGALPNLLRLPRFDSYASDAHTVLLRPRGQPGPDSLESFFDHTWPKGLGDVRISIDEPHTLVDTPGYCVAITEESSTYFKGDRKRVAGIIVTPTAAGEKTFRRFGVFFGLCDIPLPEPSIIRLV